MGTTIPNQPNLPTLPPTDPTGSGSQKTSYIPAGAMAQIMASDVLRNILDGLFDVVLTDVSISNAVMDATEASAAMQKVSKIIEGSTKMVTGAVSMGGAGVMTSKLGSIGKAVPGADAAAQAGNAAQQGAGLQGVAAGNIPVAPPIPGNIPVAPPIPAAAQQGPAGVQAAAQAGAGGPAGNANVAAGQEVRVKTADDIHAEIKIDQLKIQGINAAAEGLSSFAKAPLDEMASKLQSLSQLLSKTGDANSQYRSTLYSLAQTLIQNAQATTQSLVASSLKQ